MGRSAGVAPVFMDAQDVTDHERCIARAAEQSWCDGNVVMFGTSYYGMAQPLVATRRPPALKAFFCNEICTDYYRHLVYFGGIPGLYFLTLWLCANFTEAVVNRRVPPIVRALISWIANGPLKRYWEPIIRRRMASMLTGFMKNTPTRQTREWYANWLFDGKTRDAISFSGDPYEVLDKIDIPFVAVQNLGISISTNFGTYDLFQNAATPLNKKWMILGPPEYELPVFAWQLEAVAFFDHILRGTKNGFDAQPAVRYWLDGAETFRGSSSFPVEGSKPVRLYLASGGKITLPIVYLGTPQHLRERTLGRPSHSTRP